MEGMCNLECWCHVPTRGRSKPPCYVCVVQICSQSYKSTTSPSAPPLSPDDALEASAPPLQYVGVGAGPAANSLEYGVSISWRAPGTAEVVTDTSSDNEAEDLRQNTEPRLYQPDDDGGAVGGGPTRDFESGDHTSDDLREEGHLLHWVTSELPDTSERGTPPGAQGEGPLDRFHDEAAEEEDSKASRSDEESSDEKEDLSERIRKLVLGVDDDDPSDDSNTDPVSVRHKTGVEGDNSLMGQASPPHWEALTLGDASQEREPTTSRAGSSKSHLPRDRTKHFRPSQPFFKFNSAMREREYKRINRIISRETSSEAARRYIQRPENIPRRRLRHGNQATLIASRGDRLAGGQLCTQEHDPHS